MNIQKTFIVLGGITIFLAVALFNAQSLPNGTKYVAIIGILFLACAGALRSVISVLAEKKRHSILTGGRARKP